MIDWTIQHKVHFICNLTKITEEALSSYGIKWKRPVSTSKGRIPHRNRPCALDRLRVTVLWVIYIVCILNFGLHKSSANHFCFCLFLFGDLCCWIFLKAPLINVWKIPIEKVCYQASNLFTVSPSCCASQGSHSMSPHTASYIRPLVPPRATADIILFPQNCPMENE